METERLHIGYEPLFEPLGIVRPEVQGTSAPDSRMKRKPRRFSPRLTFSVTGDGYEALSVLAAQDDASISWVIRRAINEPGSCNRG